MWPDVFTVKQFFEPGLLNAIVGEMKAAEGSAASVYGRSTSGSIDTNVRNTLRVVPSSETIELVTRRLLSCKSDVEKYFCVSLGECEEPQFLRYREGDFFVAHQDGNTGLLQLDTERRLISTVIFLNAQSDYGGGSLVFSSIRAPSFQMVAEPGTLVAFRSETTHEVTPITHGERFSIASWYR